MSTTRRATIVLAALVGTFGLAGCGSGASDTSSTPSGGTDSFRACLAEHGVTMPSGGPGGGGFPGGAPSGMPPGGPGGGFPSGAPSGMPPGGPGGGFPGGAPSGVDPSALAGAMQACASLRPTGGPGGGFDQSRTAAFRTCMKDNGVTLASGAPTFNTADAATAKALKVCRPLLPTGGPAAGAPAPATTATPSSAG